MEVIQKAFSYLLKAKNIDDVNGVLDQLRIEDKYRMNEKVYPKIEFKNKAEEIKQLKENRLLNEDGTLTDVSDESALTRLLYALVWKNGDLQKIRHIVEGVETTQDIKKKKALVFHQFGKYLSDSEGEPIIDQHVLRAFGIFLANAEKDENEVKRLAKLSLITHKEKELISNYKKWLKEELSSELRQLQDYTYYVDKVLFALGKKVKNDMRITSRNSN